MWRGYWTTFVATHRLSANSQGLPEHGHDYVLFWLVDESQLPAKTDLQEIQEFVTKWVSQLNEKCLNQVWPSQPATVESLTEQFQKDFQTRFGPLPLWVTIQETPFFGGARLSS